MCYDVLLYITKFLFIFCRFNQYFQTEKVVITDLHEMIISLYQEILLCFLKREYVTQTKLSAINGKNGQYQLIDRQLYLGAQVMSHIDDQNVIADNIICRKNFFERYNIVCFYNKIMENMYLNFGF